MKVVFSVALVGTEFAVNEHLDGLLNILDPMILDNCSLNIETFTEEELEK